MSGLLLLPEPKRVRVGKGHLELSGKASIGISSHELYSVAQEVSALLGHAPINICVSSVDDMFEIRLVNKLRHNGYRLRISTKKILIEASDVQSAFYGVQTLRQILAQFPEKILPAMTIDDWPDFDHRGVYYDVCRGRVPKLERLLELADNLAKFKINQLQLYIEHTFRFRNHPVIGKNASPLTADDVMQLDEFCHDRHIELIPSLACFGHLATVLKHPQYHHLTEDWAKKKYVAPEADDIILDRYLPAWSLSPAVPEIYDFLDSLFEEFLPLFRSETFNVCCDETYDLGLGRSYELAKKIGKGRIYLNHILKLRDLSAKYGKRIMIWGDIIRQHPELAKELPDDVTVLDWGYDFDHAFSGIRDFKKSGLDFYACPGTSSWVSLFPRIHEACSNIAGFAAPGKRNGANGLLNTDWGDGGHYNFMECSWYGYLFGAEQAWNVRADQSSFTRRFAGIFLKIDSEDFCKAIEKLGDITHLKVDGYYQSVWQHIFFACPGDSIFDLPQTTGYACNKGKIKCKKIRLNANLGRKTLAQLDEVRKTFKLHAANKKSDPLSVLPYWIFAVDTIRHAAQKLVILGPDGNDTPSSRKAIRREMESLLKRFEELWREHNRVSEIRITRKRYQKAIKAL